MRPGVSADSLLPAVVEALDLPPQEGQDHQALLSDYLRDKSLLLVLDGVTDPVTEGPAVDAIDTQGEQLA